MSLAGFSEFFFIALLTFVIVGPKDLPKILFAAGRFMRTLRRLSDELIAELEIMNHVQEAGEKASSRKKKRVLRAKPITSAAARPQRKAHSLH